MPDEVQNWKMLMAHYISSYFRKRLTRARKSYFKRLKLKCIHSFNDVGDLLLIYSDSFSIDLYGSEQWERKERQFTKKLIDNENFDIFLDIGANSGIYSIIAANGGIKTIHAFEPNPIAFNALCANILLNDHSMIIQPWRTAISSEDGEAELSIVPGTSDVSSLTPSNMSSKYSYSNHVKCKTISIDNHIQPENKRLLIKLDVEGHELSAIKGMEKLFNKNDCLLMIEILDNQPYTLEILENYGFQIIHSIDSNYYLRTKSK